VAPLFARLPARPRARRCPRTTCPPARAVLCRWLGVSRATPSLLLRPRWGHVPRTALRRAACLVLTLAGMRGNRGHGGDDRPAAEGRSGNGPGRGACRGGAVHQGAVCCPAASGAHSGGRDRGGPLPRRHRPRPVAAASGEDTGDGVPAPCRPRCGRLARRGQRETPRGMVPSCRIALCARPSTTRRASDRPQVPDGREPLVRQAQLGQQLGA
jgi:hypothetical protein